MVIWITGLSASGKTTLAKYFKTNMKKKKLSIYISGW